MDMPPMPDLDEPPPLPDMAESPPALPPLGGSPDAPLLQHTGVAMSIYHVLFA